jgi:hypothetical protein
MKNKKSIKLIGFFALVLPLLALLNCQPSDSSDYSNNTISQSSSSSSSSNSLNAQLAVTLSNGAATAGANFASIAIGSDGSIYAAGSISGTSACDFGNGVTVTSKTGNDILLVKYNSSFVAQWGVTINSFPPGGSYFSSVAVAPDGYIYAAGSINSLGGNYDFGNGVIAACNMSSSNIVLVKYNSAGQAMNASSIIDSTNSSTLYKVTVGSDGSIYAVGLINGSDPFTFNNGLIVQSAYSGTNAVLVKYYSSGNPQWAQTTVSASANSLFNGVAVGPDGSVYAAGYITGNGTSKFTFSNNVSATGAYSGSNLVILKYRNTGVAQWATTVTSANNSSLINKIAIDSDGSVYAAGMLSGSALFGFGNSITATGSNSFANLFLIKYNTNGIAQWASTTVSGNVNSTYVDVGLGSNGSVYTVGNMNQNGPIGLGNSISVTGLYAGSNFIISKYDNTGAAQWTSSASPAPNISSFNCLTVGSDGSVYATGSINGNTAFGFGNGVTAKGVWTSTNPIIVKYK